jgi:hypothetical protein
MQKQQQEPTAEVKPPVPAYNLQHAFITYGDLRANIIEAVDVLDNNHIIPSNISRDSSRKNSSSSSSSSSLSSFNILSTTMRYCVYAVLEVCQDDNYNNYNNNNNDEVNDEVKVQENNNDNNNNNTIENINTKMLMMNRITTTTLNNINIVSTNRIQYNRNEPLSIREEFVFQNISSVYHFIIKFYVTSWSAANDSYNMNTNSVITSTLKSIQKNSYDHNDDDDDSHTVCIGFTRIPLYRLQENQTVSFM